MADMAWIGLFYLCLLLCTESGVAYGRCMAPSSADMQLFAVGLDWIRHNRNVKSGTFVMAICEKQPEQSRMYNCLDGVWKPDTPTCKISQHGNMEDSTTEATKISTKPTLSETEHCDLAASKEMRYKDSSSHRYMSAGRDIISGESVLFSCAEGYDIMDNGNRNQLETVMNTCNKGAWTKNLTCKPKSCTAPDSTIYPHLIFSHPSSKNDWFDHDVTATVTCTNEDEYEIQDDEFKPSYTSTCSYGSWLHEYRCVEKRCMLRNEPNILYNVNDTYVISTSNVTVSCRPGYKLYDKNRKMFLDIDQGAISCTKGRLTPDMTCLKEPKCPLIEKPFYNGEIFYLDNRAVHGVALFLCNEGEADLLPGSPTEMYCLDNEQWSLTENEIPSCYGLASVPEVRNGDVYYVTRFRRTLLSVGRKVQHGQNVILECRSGWEAVRVVLSNIQTYLGVESDRTSRNNNGTWEPPIPECGPAPICEPLCLNNGGECNSQGQCICPTGRVGDTCQILDQNEYRIDVQIADRWNDGTYERVWIEVIGVSGAFKQELVDDLDRFNTFSRNEKLRYRFSQIYVGEIKNVYISYQYGVDKLSIKYITIYSFKDETFYRFDSETFSSGHRLMKRMCTFTTHPRRMMASRASYRLAITEHASECQLRCIGENDCGLAVLDKRNSGYPICLGYKLGAEVYDREVQNTNMYERKDCTVSFFY